MIDVVGVGLDGLDGLTAHARQLVQNAGLIIGGQRHLDMLDVRDNTMLWPSPFAMPQQAIHETIATGQSVVVLATGDPLWFGVGKRLQNMFGDAVRCHPSVSAFQLAAARMGWSLEDVETLSIHGRPVETLRLFLNPDQRLLVLSEGNDTANTVARLLVEWGYGEARMTALSHMGDPEQETRFDALAKDWTHTPPALNTLVIWCPSEAPARPATGLPDEAFDHDGKMTKQTVRAVTLARLCPTPRGILWDLGTGCGSVAVEWLRTTGRNGEAIGVDTNADRLAKAANNALALGVPSLDLRHQSNTDFLHGHHEHPDAIFVGGGLSKAVLTRAIEWLKPFGRLVCNSVTLESEAILLAFYAEYGGHLERIAVQTATPVGPYSGWKASMPVLQWSFQK